MISTAKRLRLSNSLCTPGTTPIGVEYSYQSRVPGLPRRQPWAEGRNRVAVGIFLNPSTKRSMRYSPQERFEIALNLRR